MNFWEIYDQYYFRVKRVILGLVRDEWVADDLTQETFARVQGHLGRSEGSGKALVMDISHRVQSVPGSFP